jgi:hypothetical protein
MVEEVVKGVVVAVAVAVAVVSMKSGDANGAVANDENDEVQKTPGADAKSRTLLEGAGVECSMRASKLVANERIHQLLHDHYRFLASCCCA